MNELLAIRQLSIKKGDEYLVKDISLTLQEGEILAIIGQSGAGKTLTMLSLLGMVDSSLTVQGEILLKGQTLRADKKAWQRIRGWQIGYIFQDPKHTLNPVHTIKTAFYLIFKQIGLAKSDYQATLLALLHQVGLPNPTAFLSRYPHELSGGEAQRIAIALVLAFDPMLIIADEPTSSLDESRRDEILAVFRRLAGTVRADGTRRAVMVVSHDVASVRTIADRYVVLADGECVAQGEMGGLDVQKFTPNFGHPPPFDDNNPAILVLKNLTLAYKKPWWGVQEPMITGLNFDIKRGQIVGLVGVSGQGKSSIAKAITRLDDALVATGEILFHGKNILKIKGKELTTYRPKVLLVMQDVASSLNPRLTIKESLIEGLVVNQLPTNDDKLLTLLEFLRLPTDVLTRYPFELSGGEQGRVCLLRALLLNPELLILDEPTAMLDSETTAQVLALLRAINARFGVAILIISHDRAMVRALCQKVVVLKEKTE